MNGSPGPTALVTGVSGQDGIYLARHLLGLGYRVVGTIRPDSRVARQRAPYLAGIEVHEIDLRDRNGLSTLLDACRPAELYNLAGLTSVGASFSASPTTSRRPRARRTTRAAPTRR